MKLQVNGTELFFDVAMAEKLPYAQLHIFERSGHMVFMEEPEELVAVLKHWITSTFGMR